jgi:hypothetical protein
VTKPKPLTLRTLSRFGAAHLWSAAETVQIVNGMSPEQRQMLTELYSDDELLDEGAQLYSEMLRKHLTEQAEYGTPRRSVQVQVRNACSCPYDQRAQFPGWVDWHEARDANGTLTCNCAKEV